MLIHILSLYWLFSYLITFILFLPPSVEHSEESCRTVHLVRNPLTPQNFRNYASTLAAELRSTTRPARWEPTAGVLYRTAQSINCDSTGLRSINSRSLSHSPFREDVQLLNVIWAKSFRKRNRLSAPTCVQSCQRTVMFWWKIGIM